MFEMYTYFITGVLLIVVASVIYFSRGKFVIFSTLSLILGSYIFFIGYLNGESIARGLSRKGDVWVTSGKVINSVTYGLMTIGSLLIVLGLIFLGHIVRQLLINDSDRTK